MSDYTTLRVKFDREISNPSEAGSCFAEQLAKEMTRPDGKGTAWGWGTAKVVGVEFHESPCSVGSGTPD